MPLKTLVVVVAAGAGLAVGVGSAVAHAKLVPVGSAPIAARSDGHGTIVLGLRTLSVLRDVTSTPFTVPLDDDCQLVALASATGLVECGSLTLSPDFRLVSLRTGDLRPLPGAQSFAAADGLTNTGGATMGTQWIYAQQCDVHCRRVVLNWHTGELRVRASEPYEQPTDPLVAQTPPIALDSPALKARPKDPFVVTRFDTPQDVTYRRDGKSTKIRFRLPCVRVHVAGWRVACLARTGTSINRILTADVRTGRKHTIDLRPFPGFRTANTDANGAHVPAMVVTDQRIAVSLLPVAPTSTPADWTTTVVPWPR